jgi:hypothetical protein
MVKNELLASWVYRQGELAKQRFMEKTGLVALIAGLLLFIAIMYPLILWDTIVFNKITGWILVIALFIIVGIVYWLLQLFSGMVFGVYKKLVNIKAEEVIVTSSKIIAEKKTWILSDEKHVLTGVEFNEKVKPGQLIFKGKEIDKGQPGTSFTVTLPVPDDAYIDGEKIYTYFKKMLAAEGAAQTATV